MPSDEYVESWFGGGLCGVLIGLLVVGRLALIAWLVSDGTDTTLISF